MLIYICTAAQSAEILSFGVHLSMCFTVRKERAYIPRRDVPELVVFFLTYAAARGRAQEATPGSMAFLGLKTLSKNHPPVTQQNIAGSWAQVCVQGAPPPPPMTHPFTCLPLWNGVEWMELHFHLLCDGAGQVADAVATPIVGLLSDKSNLPCLNGRKFWLLVGYLLVGM